MIKFLRLILLLFFELHHFLHVLRLLEFGLKQLVLSRAELLVTVLQPLFIKREGALKVFGELLSHLRFGLLADSLLFFPLLRCILSFFPHSFLFLHKLLRVVLLELSLYGLLNNVLLVFQINLDLLLQLGELVLVVLDSCSSFLLFLLVLLLDLKVLLGEVLVRLLHVQQLSLQVNEIRIVAVNQL